MISEDLIKQIYFYCDNNDPNGLYTDPQGEPLDLVEYAHKLEAVISDQVRLKEHARCVEIVRSMNKDVASVLEMNKSA
jgi:hypothetical protein